MDEQQLLALKPERDRFLDRFAPPFGRDENPAHARRFVQGSLHGGERRDTENIAQAMSGGPVRSPQAFVSTGAWPDGEVLKAMRGSVLEALADDDAVGDPDETGFPKEGTKSVGVKRRYSGTLGRTDNCQVAVFANYASAKGHTLRDRRLFLPEGWAVDGDRRDEAGVPPGVIFRTRPELASERLADAPAEGVPLRWVGGDSVYGDSPTFVQGVRPRGKWYVRDSSADARAWLQGPRVIPPEQRPGPKRGRPYPQPLVVGEARRVDEVVAALPAAARRRPTVAEGSQGPRVYESAEVRAWFSEEGSPGPRERPLVRRSLGQEPELKYHRSDAPAEVPPLGLAQVRATRWTIAADIKSGKGGCGLDESETRGWVGWHHHTTLSLLASAFLVLPRARLGEERAADERARGACPPVPPARGSRLGRPGNPPVVGGASRAESPGRRQPSKAKARHAAPARSKK